MKPFELLFLATFFAAINVNGVPTNNASKTDSLNYAQTRHRRHKVHSKLRHRHVDGQPWTPEQVGADIAPLDGDPRVQKILKSNKALDSTLNEYSPKGHDAVQSVKVPGSIDDYNYAVRHGAEFGSDTVENQRILMEYHYQRLVTSYGVPASCLLLIAGIWAGYRKWKGKH